MHPTMTLITQPRKVVEPVRIRAATPRDVMHTLHHPATTALAQPALTLEHLDPACRIDSITPAPLV